MAKLVAVVLLLMFAVILGQASKMEIPSFALEGERLVIECELEHDQFPIDHIKWYKDNEVFYTYTPGSQPPATKSDVKGVLVDMKESKASKIVLSSVNTDSSGFYACELTMKPGVAKMGGSLWVYPKN